MPQMPLNKSTPEHPIIDLVANRWSARALDTRPVPRDILASVLEAARWAPSAFNDQPWRYLVLDGIDPAARADAEASLYGNAWAKRAPVLVLSIVELNRPDGSPNRTAVHDVGLANENLILQGNAHGLVVHPMAGFDVEAARARLEIPKGFDPLVMIAIGYPGDVSVLDEKNRKRELEVRTRRPISAFAFSGRWGAPPFNAL